MKVLGFDVTLPRIQRSLSKREVQFTDDEITGKMNALLSLARNATGIEVTPQRAMGVATVFACMRVLADTISTLPLEVMKRDGRTRRPAPEHRMNSAFVGMPNEEMTCVDALWAMQANLSLRSNCYAEILRDIDGDPVGFYPIETKRVECYRDPVTKQLRYKVWDTGRSFAAKDIVHIRSNTLDGVKGVDVMNTARECIALAIALQDNAAKFFGNGSRPGGVLEHPASLSKEAQERLRDQVENQTKGEMLYRLLVLEEGLKYTTIRSENKDSQFDESRQAQALEICRVFGVPPHKVGIMSGQPRANVEQDNISFMIDTIRPICIRWEKTLNMKVLSEQDREQGYYTRFNINALLRGDMKARYDAMAVGRQWGWLSANDCRELEDLPPIDGGDVYLQPLNMADTKVATEIQRLGKGNTAPAQS